VHHPIIAEQLKPGRYIILSNAIDEETNLLVLKRGKRVMLAQIPTAVLNVPQPNPTRLVLEIKEGGGFRNVIARPALTGKEIEDIAAESPIGPTPRSPRSRTK
jgi:hypothetical protein